MDINREGPAEAWARNFAEFAGVEFVPVVRVRPADKPGMNVVQYLFERMHRFEACAVALRYIDKGEGPVTLSVHAENWLSLEVELPDKLWTLPEGSKRADG